MKALNYLIPSGGYDDLFQKLGFDMKKAHRLGEIKRKKQIANTKVFNPFTSDCVLHCHTDHICHELIFFVISP